MSNWKLRYPSFAKSKQQRSISAHFPIFDIFTWALSAHFLIFQFAHFPIFLSAHFPIFDIFTFSHCPICTFSNLHVFPSFDIFTWASPPDISREHDMPTDAEGLCQTYSNNSCQCLGVSGGVCFCLLACCVTWRCHGDVWGMSGGCLRDIWVVFIEIGGSRMRLGGMWVLSPYSMEQKCYLGRALKGITFVTWPYWDIEISKWPHISFPKMVGLCHFW